MLEQIVRKNCNTRIFSVMISTVFEEQTLPVMAVWQLLLSMEELSSAVRSLMDEVRKEPGADVFFQSGMMISETNIHIKGHIHFKKRKKGAYKGYVLNFTTS